MPGKGRKFLPEEEVHRRIEIWERNGRSSQKAAREIGIGRRTMDHFLDRYVGQERHVPLSGGVLDQTEATTLALPKRGEVARYILTSAQNNTDVHRQFLRNLEAFARHIGAEIKISRFEYNRAAWHRGSKTGTEVAHEEVYYDPAIAPYVSDDIEILAPTLTWCGNMQISPTAVSPWTGWHDYTGEASTIIPHTKVSMIPVATPRTKPTKHLYTTGTCTLKNYIMAKAGQKAEFHHTFGAALVEVLPDGTWFLRQIVADEKGTFQDHPYKVSRGKVTRGAKVAAIQWGDLHVANVDPTIKQMFWGEGGALDTLRPGIQLFHDLVDGESHNHHTQQDHHEQYRLHQAGRNDIRAEFAEAREFVDGYAHRDWCQGIVVWSNHDEFIRRYLQRRDYKEDPTNAVFILQLELAAYHALDREQDPELFKVALGSETCQILTDDSTGLEIEGIVADFHGHKGTGGSRGSVAQFAKNGLKTMTGHSHSAHWQAGATSAGTCSKLDMGYNRGPSTWSHTFTVVYKGGKRQQITANAETGLWRAPVGGET